MRRATIDRKTAETGIELALDLDGTGSYDISTGVGFLDHMLTLLAVHSRFDLKVRCEGDTQVDFHHSVEDVGISLGQALREALGARAGIRRYCDVTVPMDEALVLAAVDISGRGYLGFELPIPAQKIGDFDSELVEEFFAALTREAAITLHIRYLAGRNSHHIAEAAFKAAARALRGAVAVDAELGGAVPSSKGVL